MTMKLSDVDTGAPMKIDALACQLGGIWPVQEISSLELSPVECALSFAWLASNKNWRGKATKAIAENVGSSRDFCLIFDNHTFSRMHGVGIRPITTEQLAVFQKIFRWRSKFMAGKSPVAFSLDLAKYGFNLVYVVIAAKSDEGGANA